MKRKLDPDGTSIILLNDFMYEFFPDDKKSTPDTFDLYHYNGIPNSNEGHLVRYSCGKAILLESHIYDMSNQSNSLLTCLQTKWPNIEINWNQQRVPSINWWLVFLFGGLWMFNGKRREWRCIKSNLTTLEAPTTLSNNSRMIEQRLKKTLTKLI